MNWMDIGRFLVVAGTVILVVGMVLMLADKLPMGRLPGDFRIVNNRVRIYVPVATCVLLSVLITLIVNFFSKK